MPVFDGIPKTTRRTGDLKTDVRLPIPGSLDWSRIGSDTALLGTAGVDCAKVTGDRWQQMTGDLTENYTGDKKIDVKGKHTENVVGNRSITVTVGNIERNVKSGKVTDKIAMNHEEQVGASYSLQAVKQDFQASTLININGAKVKINS